MVLCVVLCECVYSHAPPCACKAGFTLFHSSFFPALQVLSCPALARQRELDRRYRRRQRIFAAPLPDSLDVDGVIGVLRGEDGICRAEGEDIKSRARDVVVFRLNKITSSSPPAAHAAAEEDEDVGAIDNDEIQHRRRASSSSFMESIIGSPPPPRAFPRRRSGTSTTHSAINLEFDEFMKWRANSPAELAAEPSLREDLSHSKRVLLQFWATRGMSPLALAHFLLA